MKTKSGFTLIELLIVIAIVGFLSGMFLINVKPDGRQQFKLTAEQLNSDLRYVRSLALSRQMYNGAYPSGGYGIAFHNGDVNLLPNGTYQQLTPAYYLIFAGVPNNVIKRVELADFLFLINHYEPAYDLGRYPLESSISFVSESSVNTYMDAGPNNDYVIDLVYDEDISTSESDKAIIRLGQIATDGAWHNQESVTFQIFVPVCLDGLCSTGEGWWTCPQDCPSWCGNGVVEGYCTDPAYGDAISCRAHNATWIGEECDYRSNACEPNEFGAVCAWCDAGGVCLGQAQNNNKFHCAYDCMANKDFCACPQ